MLVYEWGALEQVRVSRFLRWWGEQHDKDPNNFPLVMEPGEWDEQYHMWEG